MRALGWAYTIVDSSDVESHLKQALENLEGSLEGRQHLGNEGFTSSMFGFLLFGFTAKLCLAL